MCQTSLMRPLLCAYLPHYAANTHLTESSRDVIVSKLLGSFLVSFYCFCSASSFMLHANNMSLFSCTVVPVSTCLLNITIIKLGMTLFDALGGTLTFPDHVVAESEQNIDEHS